MKIFAFVSCDSIAYTPACLNTVLLRRGNPPNCPAFAHAMPGSGQIPMMQQTIEVDQAADCYEKDAAGKWVPIKDTEENAFVYRHAIALKKIYFIDTDEMAKALEAQDQTEQKNSKFPTK